jgi:uncharacterized protein (TIGR02466 family)
MGSEFELGGRQSWPTMFFHRRWQDHPGEAPSIIEFLYRLRQSATSNVASGVAPVAKSARGLYESDFDLFKKDHPGLRKLVAWLEQTVAQAVCVANGGRANPEQVRVEIPEAWYHVSNDGGFHDAHYHPDCSWCGIYYLQAGNATASGAGGAGNGVSRFYRPVVTGGMLNDFGNSYLSNNRIDITPVDGMLLLFPSYLLHSGLPYAGERDRVLIAFNSRSHLAGG